MLANAAGAAVSTWPGNGDAMAAHTRSSGGRLIGTVAVGLVAALLNLTAVAPAAAGQPAGGQVMRDHVAARTTVTLRIARCPGCVVDVFHTAGPSSYHSLTTVPIRSGTGRFTVRTALTDGMSFGVTGTGPYTAVSSRPDIAFAVAGAPIGAPVTVARARRTHAAALCWSGTSRARFTIHVRLVTYRTLTMDGSAHVTAVAFWASPNLPGFGFVHLRRIFKGRPNISGVGDQDAPFCP
jgi:hypothetical protein